MGVSIFFFIESKTFEFSVEEADTFYVLCIYERSRESLCSVFMGKESTKCLLAIFEDLMSNVSPGHFAQTFRVGDKVFILQLGSNAHGSFLMISELLHGHRKGFIVVPDENWVVVGEDLDLICRRLLLQRHLLPNCPPRIYLGSNRLF